MAGVMMQTATSLRSPRAFFMITAFICLIGACSLSVNGKEIAKVDTKFSIDVSDYGLGVMRLALKPLVESFYEVESVVVRNPVNAELDSMCSEASCTIRSGDCTIVTHTSEDVFSAEYGCNGVVLTSVNVPLSSLDAPSVEFTFPAAKRLYGIPEHAMDLALKADVTYIMRNTDAFEYKIDDPQPLYGSIPFLLAHSKEVSTGVLFLNSAGMTVRVESGDVMSCRWTTEAGLVDLFFFPGPTPSKVQKQHASITGTTMLPPYFSLGYHQCRWNYRNINDCLSVDQGFEKHNLPYDTLWLDIEHTDEKKYFTWDKYSFPEPKVLIEALASKGRKLVTVKDPHVKVDRDYFVHEEALKGDHYVKNIGGSGNYEGNCWPGRSSWVDFYNKRTRDWYASLFHHDRYIGGSHDVHTWVDMNEPSVFDTPDKTIHSEVMHTSDSGKLVENKYLHNMYSLYSVMAVHQGHLESSKGLPHVKRPFILTRSFFSGSQRYAAMWTGDNMARWNHLQNSFPELLSLSVSNYVFVGADVGGFFFDTDEELFVRWMQAGVFYPFFRGHSHLETKRREPWMFGEVATDRIRVALALRYSLLPYLYTQLFLSHKTGEAVLRPLFYEFPHDETLYDEQYTFMFGSSLLVSPVIEQGVTEKVVTVPAGSLWYSYSTGEVVLSGAFHMAVDMNTIPMFLRGGHIIPVKLRLRRSTSSTQHDPFTLYVALNQHENSSGDVFIDDGETFNYESGLYIHRRLTFAEGRLSCTAHPDTAKVSEFVVRNTVERVIIFGYHGRPKRVVAEIASEPVSVGQEVDFEMQGGALVLRRPNLPIGDNWVILFER